MIKLIRNGEVYAPEFLGRKDILIVNNKIGLIVDKIDHMPSGFISETIDAKGRIVVPGFIDQHVHIIGGGGEAGYSSRIFETKLTDFTTAGTTTVLGLLGTDGTTRTLETLMAKARALEGEGLTTYILTGSYEYPSQTLTGSIRRDIILVDKIIGTKIAISDHRASYITSVELIKEASNTRVAGMLSKKPGILTIHVGDGKSRLDPIFEAIHNSEIPIKHFIPTHVNRNKDLYKQAQEFAKIGGFIDFTADTSPTGHDPQSVKSSDGIRRAVENGVSIDNMTISTDGNGSWSFYDDHGNLEKIGVSQLNKMHHEFKDLVFKEKFSISDALKPVTSNVARVLGIYPNKGCLAENSDADILILDDNLNVSTVIAKGQVMVREHEIIKKGMYEE